MSTISEIDKIFTSKCSTKTVQSNDAGFFTNFYLSVVDSFKSEEDFRTWLKSQFGKCESDRERLFLLYTDPTLSWEIIGTLEHVTEIYRKKDAMFSWQKREQVIKLLKIHDEGTGQVPLDKILISASQAVMRSPMKDVDKDIDNGLTLALSLVTRSDVFLRLGDGVHGLIDLQLSVKFGLPIKNNPEYYAKLSRFYALLKEDKKCEISIKLYHQLVGLDDFRRDTLQYECDGLKRLGKSQQNNTKLPVMKDNPESTSEIGRCTSSSLKLIESKNAGKYFVAKDEIEAGEVVLVEKSKCACLYPKNFGTHCNHCFKRLIAPLGCTDCASVAFCSLECRDTALSTYHKFECKYLDLLIGSGMSILCHIALRMILQFKTPENALRMGKKLSEVFCTNSSMRSEEDFFKRCLMSTFLLRCLQKAEYFGRRMTESAEPTSAEVEIGALLFTYLQSLQFNAHEIYETVTSGHKFVKSKISYIGVGIYEVGAMFNHECYPSVMRYFNGSSLIFNTIRPHASGDVIAENYGPIFTKQTVGERQRSLASRYWFKCECRACKENWPVLEKLSNKCRLKCTTEHCEGTFNFPQNPRMMIAKCGKCKQNVSLEVPLNVLNEAEEMFREGAEAMDIEDVQRATENFKSGIEMFHKMALPPHKDLHIAQESLRACIATAGNTFNT